MDIQRTVEQDLDILEKLYQSKTEEKLFFNTDSPNQEDGDALQELDQPKTKLSENQKFSKQREEPDFGRFMIFNEPNNFQDKVKNELDETLLHGKAFHGGVYVERQFMIFNERDDWDLEHTDKYVAQDSIDRLADVGDRMPLQEDNRKSNSCQSKSWCTTLARKDLQSKYLYTLPDI